MRIALFCHSLLSDWNHGNAHFLRGVVTELAARGHDVRVFEPRDAWSVENLIADHGAEALGAVHEAYPGLRPHRYDEASLDLEAALEGVDLVLVHEWSPHDLVRRLGEHRRRGARHRLLFHDTHHRSVTDPTAMGAYDLSGYDGVLAFGEVVREIYVRRGWASRAFTWHEAADVRVFAPRLDVATTGDLVWVGNWGDDERTAELHEFLLEPVSSIGLRARVHGVRYPAEARAALTARGIEHRGWVANFRVPRVFAEHLVTVHVPRRPYVESLPGIPTIRPFEALACGIPLVCSPWSDAEGLFRDGDFLVARDGAAMTSLLRMLMNDASARAELSRRGRETILARHTCAHRVDELLAIVASLGPPAATSSAAATTPSAHAPPHPGAYP
jgi:spore maturation protein CgeB